MKRSVFVGYLAAVWLIVPYPYGLLLFLVSACGYRSLQSQVKAGQSNAVQ